MMSLTCSLNHHHTFSDLVIFSEFGADAAELDCLASDSSTWRISEQSLLDRQ